MSLTTFIDVDGHGVTIDRLSGTRIRFYEEQCAYDYNAVKLILDGMKRDDNGFSTMFGLNVKVNSNVPVGTAMLFKDGELVAMMYNIGPPPTFPEPATDPWEEQG